MKYVFALAALSFLLWLPSLFSGPGNLVADAFGNVTMVSASEPEQRLSLKEQIGQMMIVGIEGTRATELTRAIIKEVQPGGILLLARNIEDKEQLSSLLADLQDASPIPLFVAVDQEGPALSRIPFADTPQDLKELGVNMNFAPVLDSRNPDDFVFPRTLKGKDVISLAQEFIAEHQKEGVVAVPKHFPGYDTVSFNPENTVIPKTDFLPDTLLFEQLFQESSLSLVMVSHVVFEDLDSERPFPFSAKGIAILKAKLGENPLVMSDDLLSKAFLQSYSLSEIGENALRAGIDILLAAGYPETDPIVPFSEELLKEAQQDPELQKRITAAALRILEKKQELMIY